MKNKKSIARFLLKPALDALGGPCIKWRAKVRLFAHDLLKKNAGASVAKHVKTCRNCRIFFLECVESKKEFLAAYSLKADPVADKLSTGKDALVKVFPTSKTRRNIPLAPRNWKPEQEDVKKELKNEKK